MSNVEYLMSVPYSVKQMFGLINDINSYAKFLPGCDVSRILEYHKNELIAKLSFVVFGTVGSIITHNIFVDEESISIFLIKGPFKEFYGRWEFIAITDSWSKIKYVSYYQFCSLSYEIIFKCFFQEMHKHMIHSFVSRANKLYGEK